jgi:4-diphosphocytidyl-2-C-methyl-D-erythritol kinase
MLSEWSGDAVLVQAPAKVNLFLEVLGKRTDGYHEIASLMVTVGLYDRLVFRDEPAGSLVLTCDDPALSTGPDNLVVRAAELLRRHTGCQQGARIELHKRIPMAAGLAGGSSDAAATLAGLNRLWRLGLADSKLAALGAEIGSDVAFFFAAPAAWCTGRGEVVTPVNLGRPLHLLLACPDVGLATADVYRGVKVPTQPEDGDAIRRAVAVGDVQEIGRRLHNRLQPAAEALSPEVGDLLAQLAAARPTGQLMTGSGSCVFALGRDRADIMRLARRLRRRPGPKESLPEGPPGRGPRLYLVCSSV